MEKVLFYFLLFIIYSFAGWLIEITVVRIKDKKFVNRGFLIGPYCPIYGCASIIMILYLSHYKDNILNVFLLAVCICTFIEYIISYLMEKLFGARWWDYSNRKFNINGRVCLSNAFAFGFLGVLLIYLVNPFLTKIISMIDVKIINIISIILLIIFIIDFVISFNLSCKIKNTIHKIRKDSTEEINQKTKEIIENKVLNRRIFKAFPNLKLNLIKKKIIDTKNNIEKKIEKRRKN